MALRDFHLPDRAAPQAERRLPRSTRLVGGSMAMRRAHGTPSALRGRLVLDPVFVPEHLDALRTWCDPADPRPLVVEIGFQRGRFARAFCLANPETRYVGFEVRAAFCRDADAWLTRGGVDDARLALVDAREALPLVVEPGSVDAIFAFFPDPWWKKKHMKKRLMTEEFAADAARWLRAGGRILLKTDVEGYADWAEAEMTRVESLRVRRLEDPAAGLPPTQRERRCALRGMPTWAIEGRKEPGGT